MKFVWFRNDLRVRDNPALYQACKDAARQQGIGQQGVIAVVTLCPQQWRFHDDAPSKVAFWLANLQQLRVELSDLNVPLKIISTDIFSHVAEPLLELAKDYQCDGIYANREYCLNEIRRDDQVEALFRQHNLAFHHCQGDTVIEPGLLLNQSMAPYKVFTPFSKAWRSAFSAQGLHLYPTPEIQPELDIESDPIPSHLDGYDQSSLTWHKDHWPVGADAAHETLASFCQGAFHQYTQDRDFPALDGTSSLSPYLTAGVLSPRQCLAGISAYANDSEWIATQWITEIIWRDFYRHLMVLFPQLNRWEPFRPEVENRIIWHRDDHLFQAWCDGETGFPIVDAGMKQLKATGWMHNRVRMIVASFLTKLLRQDWRQGARFFMEHLIDGDFASNAGGWQWSASVGADAAPYFRIFNPTRQAERFDPMGEYIAHWLPELAKLSVKQRMDPAFGYLVGRPSPIIDYKQAREESLLSYKNH